MNKQTAALRALFAGWILTADIANATAYETIAGQWCGDVTDYVFAPSTLTVKFHDGRPGPQARMREPLLMSALPPKADIDQLSHDVRFVP